jgi:hypothetical protein
MRGTQSRCYARHFRIEVKEVCPWGEYGQSKCRVRSGFAKAVPPMLVGVTMTLVPWNREVQNAAMQTLSHATKSRIVLPPCFPGTARRAEKQIPRPRDLLNLFISMEETGAGEGIRTLDPNLGKVVLYP